MSTERSRCCRSRFPGVDPREKSEEEMPAGVIPAVAPAMAEGPPVMGCPRPAGVTVVVGGGVVAAPLAADWVPPPVAASARAAQSTPEHAATNSRWSMDPAWKFHLHREAMKAPSGSELTKMHGTLGSKLRRFNGLK